MTSNPPTPGVIRSKDKDASSNSPPGHRTTASASSSSNPRYSLSSGQTGESSTSATNRNSLARDGVANGPGERESKNGGLEDDKLSKDSKRSHRSRRSRTSGGFLLSNSFFEPPSHGAMSEASAPEQLPYQRPSAHDPKGKSALRSPEKLHTERRSNVGAGGLESSPLAANATVALTGRNLAGEIRQQKGEVVDDGSGAKPTAPTLDVDSAQIVNLALNLSESRHNARRNISTPLLPIAQGLGEGFAGGSLRQHLQQQRRISRNISPRSDRGGRAMTPSPRITPSVQIYNPLQGAFDTQPDGSYQYHFSPSTLARAAKAKNVIELMAEYRRLLQYVPPLKPQLERVTSNDRGPIPSSPTSAPISRAVSVSSHAPRPLGRLYNPLQYIRNRKVRARNAKAIDGESQGFGDLSKVSSWIDQVATEASSEDSHLADCLFMPSFSKAADAAASPHTSPQSGSGKGQAAPPKVKRPRIDWVTSPADMIADVFWLEQDDNKKMIENRHGRKIFPPAAELKRPMSRKSEEPEPQLSPNRAVPEDSALDLRLDTKLPEFKSIKGDLDKHPDSAGSRARQKLRHVRNATRIHHNYNGSIHDRSHLFRSRSRSHSDSSDSGSQRRSARRRSGTVDSNDRATDILEKQMMQMLQKEAQDSDRKSSHDFPGDLINRSAEPLKPLPEPYSPSEAVKDGSNYGRTRPVMNQTKTDAAKNGSSGRASLEVPASSPRRSLEELDSTAPNSPEVRASKLSNAFVPSLAMNFSPPRSRNTSQTRNPLSKVKSKILPFRDHSLERSRSRVHMEESQVQVQPLSSKELIPGSPDTPERRRRSMSPTKHIPSGKADEDSTPLKQTSSLRKNKGEDSGIRGLFKNSRNPVARVGELFWKASKEPSPEHGVSSNFSTDESDIEDFKVSQALPAKIQSHEGPTGVGIQDAGGLPSRKETPSYINDMPVFASPFERRGRSVRARGEDVKSNQQIGAIGKRISQLHIPEPTPRIDVQTASPTTSPDHGPVAPFHRDSSISDLDSRRGSFMPGVESADARLNAILGLPGKHSNTLPVTGLANLDVGHDQSPSQNRKREWSISDRGISIHRGPMTKREIARVEALLLSSGIKAKEISRRATELKDLRDADETYYSEIAELAQDDIIPVPKCKQHILAARILSSDMQLSSRMWQESADAFANTTITGVLRDIENLQTRLSDDLTPMTRKAADEADEVSKDLVTSQTLTVKKITDKINTMMRRRRRRFRWLRRGGWVLLEWALVGVMWYVWFVVVLARVFMGVGKGVVGSLRWLFWL
ncbi:uncharacterized protein BP5553_09962 [Venustampulla echinocandica]|uniref:Uncharacterized protein n=1 Tax=Venustampulla echinocandica TaxID=2656787 RepID=A0A370TB61_9HELO|nr:uncharacterized protein BP5553_09962 [Venustampulla echinocandica]RDL31173.1 hypothetical protein BP5553_09962 [Venustampulla echinocandica]